MALSFSGGYTEFFDWSNAANTTLDWSGGATITGLSNAQGTGDASSFDTSPSFTNNMNAFQQPHFSGSDSTVGLLNSSALSTKDHSASRRILVLHAMPTWPGDLGTTGQYKTIALGGLTVAAFSGASYANHIEYSIAGSDTSPIPAQHFCFTWEPGYATGAFATTGTFDNTDIQFFGCWRRASSGTAARYVWVGRGGYCDPYVGSGSSADPWGDVFNEARGASNDDTLLVDRVGEKFYTIRCAVTWGAGSTETLTLTDTTNRTINWADDGFMSDGHIGFEHNGGRNHDTSGNTAAYNIIFPDPRYFRLVYGDASALVGSLTYGGWTVENASSVVIHAEFTINNFTFNNGAAVDLTDGAVTCGTMLTINGGTGAVQLKCDDPSNIDALTFTATDDTSSGYCWQVAGSTRTITAPPVFADGTETAIIEYTGSGTLTVNQNATGDTLTGVATGGGSISIVSATTWSITDSAAPNGARYEAVGSTTGTISNGVVSGGSGINLTSLSLTSGETVRLRWWLDNEAASGATANQVKWKNAAQTVAAGGGAISFAAADITDWSTYFQTWAITSPDADLGSDFSNIEVEYSGSGESMDPAHIIKFISMQIGSNSSGSGITNWFPAGGPVITVQDSGNVQINVSVVDLHIVNTGAGDLLLLGVGGLRIFRSDNSTLFDGTSLMYDTGKTYTSVTSSGLTAGESAAITAIKSKTDSLTFSVSGKVDSNLTHVGGVSGTGALALEATVGTVDTVVDGIAAQTTDIHKRFGLNASFPVTVSSTAIEVDDITQSLSTESGVTTIQRST